ncbi:AAA family ATPase [Bacillus paranthracis]|uniref:AAA family ATPase n=1 Tax=Bacillus paranthracis TaxID=2026186 RepID=UPI003D21E79A
MESYTYYQANPDGSIVLGEQPKGPSKTEVIETLRAGLSFNGWSIEEEQSSNQPYVFKLSSSERTLDVYVYCWRISNGGRNREFEQRIQIGKCGEEGFQIDNRNQLKKGLLFGMYKQENCDSIIVAWETENNRERGASKSCFVDIRSIAQAMRDGFVQTKDNKGNLICVFKKEFLNFYISNMELWHKQDFSSLPSGIEFNAEQYTSAVQEKEEYSSGKLEKGINKIVYGAPGTGKSYNLGKNCVRVTFHPEYTYFDFVGGLKPCKNTVDNKISYEFVPGPFLRVLKDALSNQEKMHTLVIEEINRANTAAVFGDIFQLLDRDENGWSEYGIENKEILDYLNDYQEDMKDYTIKEIKIPGNLNIFATMNSADQGVFVMDSAFKRRWEFEYRPVSFKDVTHAEQTLEYGKYQIKWKDFADAINTYLAFKLGINEDKLIGPYFMKKNELDDNNKIAYKLLIYLWDDVVRYDRSELFNKQHATFSSLSQAFISGKGSIFVEDLEQKVLEKCIPLKETSGINE